MLPLATFIKALAFVPEPMTLVLLGIGSFALLKKLKR